MYLEKKRKDEEVGRRGERHITNAQPLEKIFRKGNPDGEAPAEPISIEIEQGDHRQNFETQRRRGRGDASAEFHFFTAQDK